ncbi:DUF1049 domain-containing protein [Soehngenia saccharolytica]|nr:DUF1049 domain-containing protein [Soehngenia saccharolytica]
MQKSLIITLILSIVVIIFAINNNAIVTIDLIFTQIEISEAIVIFVCVLLGVAITSIFSWFREMKLKKVIKQQNSKIDDLNKNIESLERTVTEKEEQIKLLYLKDENNSN